MTDPEFCFRSNVQYPNRLLGFYDAPELLQTSSPKYDMIIIIIISFPCPITRGLGTEPTLAVILDAVLLLEFRPSVSQSGLGPPQNCT
jgi:hypothetical protein